MCILLVFRDAIQNISSSKIIIITNINDENKNLFQISLNSHEYNFNIYYIWLLSLIESKSISCNKHRFQKKLWYLY